MPRGNSKKFPAFSSATVQAGPCERQPKTTIGRETNTGKSKNDPHQRLGKKNGKPAEAGLGGGGQPDVQPFHWVGKHAEPRTRRCSVLDGFFVVVAVVVVPSICDKTLRLVPRSRGSEKQIQVPAIATASLLLLQPLLVPPLPLLPILMLHMTWGAGSTLYPIHFGSHTKLHTTATATKKKTIKIARRTRENRQTRKKGRQNTPVRSTAQFQPPLSACLELTNKNHSPLQDTPQALTAPATAIRGGAAASRHGYHCRTAMATLGQGETFRRVFPRLRQRIRWEVGVSGAHLWPSCRSSHASAHARQELRYSCRRRPSVPQGVL